jgi:hypothetical protein
MSQKESSMPDLPCPAESELAILRVRLAAGQAGSRISYATALLSLEERRQAILVAAANGGSLGDRIRRLAGIEQQSGHPAHRDARTDSRARRQPERRLGDPGWLPTAIAPLAWPEPALLKQGHKSPRE